MPSRSRLESLNDLADQILKTNLEKLKKNAAHILRTFDPEKIHDMRVAMRRLRAAIKTFKRILPNKAQKIRAELRKMSLILGKKRDLDVFSEFIRKTVNAKSISLQKLAKQSDQSRKQIRSMLKSKRYARLIESLEQLKAVSTRQNILKVSRNRIRKELNKVLEIGSSIHSKVDDKALHKFRISIKKLRYVSEFFEPIFSKYIFSLKSFIEKTKKVQDILGEHQDAISGISMLHRHKSAFSSEEFLQIKREYDLKKKRMLKLFLKIWKG